MTTAMQGKARLNQLPKRLTTAAKEFNEEDMLYYAAALSYQVFFSLFPFLFFVLALLGSLNIPGFWAWLRTSSIVCSTTPMPGCCGSTARTCSSSQSQSSGLLSLWIIIALGSASSGV